MQVEGVSLLRTKKNDFAMILNQIGLKGLIEKLDEMNNALKKFKHNYFGFIDNSFKNYEHSLIARTEFLKKNNGVYLQHGGKNIMTGYGSIAFQLDKQIEKGKSIGIYTSVGAGGPIGIGLCLKYLRDVEVVIIQTEEFDAFVRTLKSNEICVNDPNNDVGISDGIAVDKPEFFAVKISIKYI